MVLYSFQLYFLPIYIGTLLLITILYMRRRNREYRQNKAILKAALESGMDQPSSLYPKFNHARCIGCGACIAICPEHPHHKVLGLIDGKSNLITPSECIGHGACKEACPMGAITLVFGTTERGVDIPKTGDDFETDVPGVFIAGELGGSGLIKNAIEKGRLAIESVHRKLPARSGGDPAELDVVIIGAGPAGFSATLSAMQKNIRYATVEQEDAIGGTVVFYPKGKLVMTAPVEYPTVGPVEMRETTREELLEFWSGIERDSGVKINFSECVEKVTRVDSGFEVKTNRSSYRTRSVLLTLGRRGTPRKLEVPGEDLPKVVYRLQDPADFRGKHVLVVGGGDSALEAATSIAAEPGATVAISYRSEAFSRAKEKNRRKAHEAEKAGQLNVLLKSSVTRITQDAVELEQNGKSITLKNEGVIVCAGGVLPTKFIQDIGVTVETKYGTP